MGLIKCKHSWKMFQASNVIQQDEMGYPLRLFIMECKKCGKTQQEWIDVSVSELDEIKTGESVLLRWR